MKSVVWLCMLVVLVGFVIISSIDADASDITVDIGGNGDYLSIQSAVDNSSDGDIIFVWSGTYSENVEVNKSVSIVGNGSAFTVIDDGSDGAVLNVTSSWVNVSSVNITSSGNHGVNVSFADWFSIFDCEVYSNLNDGINIYSSSHVDVLNNTIMSNGGHGVLMSGFNLSLGCKYFNLTDNTIYSNAYNGITTDVSGGWGNISGNAIYANGGNGINVRGSFVCLYDNVIFSQSSNGLMVNNNNNNTILSNHIYANGGHGISFINSMNICIEDNIIETNVLSGLYAGGTSKNGVIQKNVIRDNGGVGLYLTFLSISNFTIIDNTLISNNSYGIRINAGDHNVIENNTLISNNTDGIILQSGACYNVIGWNNISSNSNWGVYITGYSNWNVVHHTVLYDNLVGVFIENSSNNTVHDCNFLYNTYGVNITGNSYNNKVYNNNFINNTIQANDGIDTSWDDGSGRGNYWSDYGGVDLDGDGVGDTEVAHLGLDSFPLIYPTYYSAPEEPVVEASVGEILFEFLLSFFLLLIIILFLAKVLLPSLKYKDVKKPFVGAGKRKKL